MNNQIISLMKLNTLFTHNAANTVSLIETIKEGAK